MIFCQIILVDKHTFLQINARTKARIIYQNAAQILFRRIVHSKSHRKMISEENELASIACGCETVTFPADPPLFLSLFLSSALAPNQNRINGMPQNLLFNKYYKYQIIDNVFIFCKILFEIEDNVCDLFSLCDDDDDATLPERTVR